MKTTKTILLLFLLTFVCNCSKQTSDDIVSEPVESLLIKAQETIKEQEVRIKEKEIYINAQEELIRALKVVIEEQEARIKELSGVEEGRKESIEGIFSGIITVEYANDMGSWWNGGSGTTTIEFMDGKYSCSGYSNNIPGGGSGTYSIQGEKIIFVDNNGWFANFDWGLILNGEYDFTFDGKKLKFSRGNDYAKYEYDLVKE